jgi:hypothetical protein
MKPNIKRGKGFRGLLNYCLGPDKGAEIVGGNMVSETPRDLAREFGQVRQIKAGCDRPVWHCSLSLPDGERLSAAQWAVVTAAFAEKMGLSDRQFVAVRHSDSDHDHVHIVANRIGADGRLWHGAKDAEAAQKASAEIEREFGLSLTYGQDEPTPTLKKPALRLKQAEIEMWGERNKLPPKALIAAEIDRASAGRPGLAEFARRLNAAGVAVRIHRQAETGAVRGLSFGRGDDWYSASQIRKDLGWAKFSARLSAVDLTPEEMTRWAAPIVDQSGVAGGARPAGPARSPARVRSAARYKQQLLTQFHGRPVDLDDDEAELIRYVKRQDDGSMLISLAGGQTLLDGAGKVTLRGAIDTEAVAALMSACDRHGWQSIELTGSAEFQHAALAEAVRRGIHVTNPELQAEQTRLIAQMRAAQKPIESEMENENGAAGTDRAARSDRGLDTGAPSQSGIPASPGAPRLRTACGGTKTTGSRSSGGQAGAPAQTQQPESPPAHRDRSGERQPGRSDLGVGFDDPALISKLQQSADRRAAIERQRLERERLERANNPTISGPGGP